METVLFIAGSDPGGGAGIQQDLKVAALLGAHGTSAVTALTVQNTRGVQAVHPVAPEVVAAQLDAVLGDFAVAAVKLGMLASAGVARVVAARLREAKVPWLVVDPVLAAGDGTPLLTEDGIAVLKEEIMPLASVVTPNLAEASRLAGVPVRGLEDMEAAAQFLLEMGPKWVLIKGGHLEGEPVDVIFDVLNCHRLPGRRLPAGDTHGTGCTLAAALATHLAQGKPLPEAVTRARELVFQAIRHARALGRGRVPLNPYAPFARELERHRVLTELSQAVDTLRRADVAGDLIPEVQSNLGYASRYAEDLGDVAAFPGRILKGPEGLIIPCAPAFGASRHIAAIILTAQHTHPEIRAAMNIRYVEEVKRLAPLLHMKLAGFDRAQEPPEIKTREGSTLAWGVASILKAGEPPPDLIYDRGDWGKEAMIRVLGPDPLSVVEKALALAQALRVAGGA